jgi:hypothetical protein
MPHTTHADNQPDHLRADGEPCPHPLASCPMHGKVRPSVGILENPNAGGSMLSVIGAR